MAIEQGALSPTAPVFPTVTKPVFPSVGKSSDNPPDAPLSTITGLTGPLPVEPAKGTAGQWYGGTVPLTAAGLGMITMNNIFDVAKMNEALAASQGMSAWYSVPTSGNITGWGGPLGEAVTRAGGQVSNINVAYLTEAEQVAARAAAIAEETRRGHSVVQEAYQYIKTGATRFQPLASHTVKDILGGLSQAGNALFQFSLIPLNTLIRSNPWLSNYDIGGGPPTT